MWKKDSTAIMISAPGIYRI